MPFYQLPGLGVVHMKGRGLPKPCVAQVWRDGAQETCAAPSAFLCDGDEGGGRTCDKPLCEAHAIEIARNRHHCPDCFQIHGKAQPQLGLFTHLVRP